MKALRDERGNWMAATYFLAMILLLIAVYWYNEKDVVSLYIDCRYTASIYEFSELGDECKDLLHIRAGTFDRL